MFQFDCSTLYITIGTLMNESHAVGIIRILFSFKQISSSVISGAEETALCKALHSPVQRQVLVDIILFLSDRLVFFKIIFEVMKYAFASSLFSVFSFLKCLHLILIYVLYLQSLYTLYCLIYFTPCGFTI